MQPTNKIELMERSILGQCLEGQLNTVVSANITPETFTSQQTREIFKAMVDNDLLGNECDMPTIAAMVSPETVVAVLDLTEYRNSTQNLAYAIKTVKNYAKRRTYARKCFQIYEDARKADPLGYYPIEDKINEIIDGKDCESRIQWMNEGLAKSTLEEIESDQVDPARSNLITLDEPCLDAMIGGGFKPKQLITIAARTACGKTTLATNIALRAAKSGHIPLFITVDLDSKQLAERLYCTDGSINTMHMAAHRLDQAEWNRAHSTLQTFQNMKMGINGETGGSWEQVEAAVKHGCRMKGVDCVFVDYIQQFHVMSKKLSIREEINYMTSRAKQLAMDFKIPFFIVAQLNREVEKRQGKPPLLSDIKESSSIENDSDVVLLLYKTKENVDDLPNFQEDLWIKIAKNRSGMCGSTEVGVDFSKNKILQKQKENEYEQRIKHI